MRRWPFSSLLELERGLGAVVQLHHDALEVEDDVDDVLLHPLDRGVLVENAGDLHLGRGVAGHRREQDAAQRIAQRVPVAALEGSMITFACVGERFWTSMMRGFRKVVALLCIRVYL
jgi:hypothetical protein